MRILFKVCRSSILLVITLSIILLTSATTCGQISKLQELIRDMPEDTARINAINTWVSKNCRGHLQDCLPYTEEALVLSRQLNYAEGIAYGYFNKGGMYRVAGLADSSIYYLELSNRMFDSLGLKRMQAPVLNELGIVYRNRSMMKEAIEAHALSAKFYGLSGDSLRMAMALNNEATVHQRMNNDMTEDSVRQRALGIARRTGNKPLEGMIMLNIANKFLNSGQNLEAIEEYEKIIRVYRDAKQVRRITTVQNNMAIAYMNMGNYTKALNLHLDNLRLSEDLDDLKRKAFSVSNIGDVYATLGEFDKALPYHQKATGYFSDMKNTYRMALSYVNEAEDLRMLDSLDQALDRAGRSLSLLAGTNPCQKDKTFVALGSIFLDINQPDSARSYFDRGYQTARDCNNLTEKALAGIELARLTLRTDPGNAEKLLLEAYQIGRETANPAIEKDAAQSLAETYEIKGNNWKALDYYKYYQQLNDSLFDQQKLREFSFLEANAQFEEDKRELVFAQEKERIRLEEERKLANLKFAAAASIALILLVAGLLIYRAGRSKSRTNQKLEEANRKLHQLDEFKSRLFANINHDIRTPLTLIQGYASRIAENGDNYLTNNSEEDLNHLQRNTMILAEMTNEIQDLLLLEEKKLKISYQKVYIQEYVSRLVKMFNSLAQLSDISLYFHGETDDRTIVHLDENHFEKIFYNLISNAFRYTPPGGEISVTISVADEHFSLLVSDSGKGISEEDLPHIFDRFYQSPLNEFRSKEGFGIGLAVVRELVVLHGGEITVESTEGQGTQFRVFLPFNLDKEITERGSESNKTIENHPVKSARDTMISTEDSFVHTIMVVDDHEEIRKYISDIVKKNYRVKEASDGKQALRILEKNHVDLIITDLMMPWLDGYDLIERLKESEKFKNIPVMVVSARTTEDDKYKVLDAGVNDFISKPFDPIELAKRIRNLLKNSDQVNKWSEITEDQDTLSDLEQNILKKLNQVLIDNISNPDLNTDMIARELSASRSKAIRLIKNLTGKTPLEYIRETRLNYVDDLIKRRRVKNATEAVAAIGMKHVTHFSKQYKNYFGEPPVFPDE